MGPGGWFLLLLVATCIIALVVLAKKRKELEEGYPYSTDSGSGSATSKPVEEEKAEEQGPPQNTMYAYRANKTNRLCPFCDGENISGAQVCVICGRDL